jgi:hypothetical protein
MKIFSFFKNMKLVLALLALLISLQSTGQKSVWENPYAVDTVKLNEGSMDADVGVGSFLSGFLEYSIQI